MTGARVRGRLGALGRAGSWLAALGLVALSGSAARAEGAQRVIHLAYRAPATCPDEAALLARIRGRVDVRTGPPVDGVPAFGVTLQADGDRIVGRIASTNEKREPTSREVSGTDCSHVVDAVALIVSMALSPTGGKEGTTAVAPADNAKPDVPKPDAAKEASTLPQPTETTGNRGAGPAAETNNGSTTGPRAQWKLLGSATVEGAYVYAPTPSFGFGARLQLFRSASFVGGPSVALGYAHVLPTENASNAGGSVSLKRFDLAELLVCPASVALHAAVTFLPCARLDVGQLEALGSGVANAKSETRAWVAAGALGQVAFVPAKPFVIDVQGSLLFPLTPYKFVFSPDSANPPVAYDAPRVGFSVSLGVGVMFL